MRSLLTAGLLAGSVFVPQAWAADATPPAAAPAAAYDAATVLATVNGTDITLGNVIMMRANLPQQYQSLPDDTLMKGIVQQLVDQTLLADQLSKSADTDPLSVKLQLQNDRRSALAGQVAQQAMAQPVDDAAVKAAYDKQVADFKPQPEYDASHILVKTEDEAKKLLAEITGGKDFAAVAKANSTDGSAAQGGELGWFSQGQMVPEFEAAVAKMKVGEVAGPIQTQFGWHLIKLNATRDSTPPPLDQVRPDIENELHQQALQAQLEQLRSGATIEIKEAVVPATAIHQDDLIQN